MILSKAELRNKYSAKALNFLEVYAIGRSDLFELIARHPSSAREIRFYTIRLALTREVVKDRCGFHCACPACSAA